MKRFFILVFLASIASASFSQVAATVKGELLIQLKLNTTPADVEKEALEELGILPALKMKEVVSDYMRIWLFTFNEDEIAKRDMIRMMNTLKSVSVAQANHIVADRVVPNDPFFGQQWHHYQENDHDIDSDLAWDITTGGVTANGDSIVVCIVEIGGAKWDVPDIIENHWTNIHEIPDNGIDDDGNGYIDDYHGWSVTSNDDEVFGNGSHGAQVSSMIGAKGNNGVGVSGVNWNVKLMQVRMGSIVESSVIAAYTYPLIMRKKYNQSNGEQGAFVVATNSSWGTNFGQPADAPLWCAMYDSLGVYGVLSCGATANSSINVDTQGDLPTACPSDYLLSVTNTNSSDVKVNSAGYGVVTIDLGAPGNQVFLANNSAYGNTSGTSFSSPCVAGAIALLYSAPCSSFMSVVNQDGAEAALHIKNYILEGVDQTELLQTQTLSGGRLNVNNSLSAMLDVCGSCIPPLSPFAEQVAGTLNYNINWIMVSEVQSVVLRYRTQGSAEWIEVSNLTSSPHLLSDLFACSTYEFQLMGHCDAEASDWTEVFSFETDGCCIHPTDVLFSSIEENSAYVLWNQVMAAVNYSVTVTDQNGSSTAYNAIPDPVLLLDNLEACMQYSVWVYSNCIGEAAPPQMFTFQTPGCGACTDLTYCSASGGSNTEYIRRVIVGDIDYESTAGVGYNFITTQTTDFIAGDSYPIQCYPGFIVPTQTFNQNFRVWIDYNNDGEFQHPEEMAFDGASPTQVISEGDIVIPTNATSGYTRMRVAMRYAQFSTTEPSVCNTWDYGEVEDYCVTIVNTSAIVNIEAKQDFYVFPNPVANELFFQGAFVQYPNLLIRLYDMNGLLVKQTRLSANSSLDVSDLSAGLYSIVVVNGDRVSSTRFVKQ